MKRWAVGAIAVLSLAAGSAVAQEGPPSPEEQARNTIETRQGLFKLMGWNMAPIAGMLRNRVPFDAAVVQKSAERLDSLSLMIPDLFQADTRQFKSIKTG